MPRHQGANNSNDKVPAQEGDVPPQSGESTGIAEGHANPQGEHVVEPTQAPAPKAEPEVAGVAPTLPATIVESQSLATQPSTQATQDVQSALYGLSVKNKRVVRNMADNFDFFNHALEEILDPPAGHDHEIEGDRLSWSDLASRLHSFSISTSYSGIGAPETTLHIIDHYVREIGNKRGHTVELSAPKILYQIEYDASCRTELLRYKLLCSSSGKKDHKNTNSDTCCFGDLNSFYRPELQEVISQLKKQPELALEVLSNMVASGEAIKTCSWCYSHEKYCHLCFGFKSWDSLLCLTVLEFY